MDLDSLELLVESLPATINLMLFDQMVAATLAEYGMQINGYYVVLETMSPEGYNVKFSIFDNDIRKLLNDQG